EVGGVIESGDEVGAEDGPIHLGGRTPGEAPAGRATRGGGVGGDDLPGGDRDEEVAPRIGLQGRAEARGREDDRLAARASVGRGAGGGGRWDPSWGRGRGPPQRWRLPRRQRAPQPKSPPRHRRRWPPPRPSPCPWAPCCPPPWPPASRPVARGSPRRLPPRRC